MSFFLGIFPSYHDNLAIAAEYELVTANQETSSGQHNKLSSLPRNQTFNLCMLFLINNSSNIWKLFVRNCVNTAKYGAIILFLASAIPSQAQVSTIDSSQDDPYKFYVQTSLATVHFHPDGQNNHQGLLDVEWNYKKDYLVGAGIFSNSYNQPTQMIYWGAKFHPIESAPNLYLELVGGLIHGYTGQHKDSIPLNQLGTAPVILPAVGYCYKQVCSELIVFGTAGSMLTAGVRF